MSDRGQVPFFQCDYSVFPVPFIEETLFSIEHSCQGRYSPHFIDDGLRLSAVMTLPKAIDQVRSCDSRVSNIKATLSIYFHLKKCYAEILETNTIQIELSQLK